MIWLYKSLFPAVWITFLIYWRIKAVNTKTVQRLESARWRILRAVALSIAVVLVSTTWIPLLWLYWPVWRQGVWPFWLGASVTIGGLLFAVWAREHLGRNWSHSVTIKEGHELITTGPYAVVRHPIYAGILGGFFGLTIALCEVRGFVAIIFVFLGFWAKLRLEERWMRSEFGETYETYADRTSALVPYLF